MWNRIRRRVLRSRTYEPQHNTHFRDLEDENDDVNLESCDKIPDSPDGLSHRMTNGFTKCLINNLNSNPISCACKRNVSPVDTHVPEEKLTINDKSNSLTIGKNLNYYFKETDSCELVRKNKSSLGPNKTPKSKVTNDAHSSHGISKKSDSHLPRSSSTKDKHQTPLFSAGQRNAKSGIDFNEFHHAFDSSEEVLVENSKTVTFETFGKPVPNNTDVKPPLFLPIKKKTTIEDSPACESSLLDGSVLPSSKGASVTSEEGVESGYGTQDDGNDRLARSVSSSSESNAPDFIGDFNKPKWQISHDSTGEEDVFHRSFDNQKDKCSGGSRLLSATDNASAITKPHHDTRHHENSPVNQNMNIVVAEVHAENFDEPHVCGTKSITMKQTGSSIKTEVISPGTDNRCFGNRSSDIVPPGNLDINRNPAVNNKTILKNRHNEKVRQMTSAHVNDQLAKSAKSQSDKTASVGPDSDSDDDIKEYLPADVNSMSEVYNSSLSEKKADGTPVLADLYASVPKPVETDHVIQTITSPPSHTVILPKDAKSKTKSRLNDKHSSRPDVIDCHDRTPTPPAEAKSVSILKQNSEFEDDDKLQSESGDENVVISDDGDSGPPLPMRNYNQTLTKDKQPSTDLIQQICEAPTLVIRQKSKDASTPSTTSTPDTAQKSTGSKQIPAVDEIEQQEEPIHMSWDEVMKEAKTLGIPLNPPTSTQTLDQRRCSSSSQSSACTPVASPVVKRNAKVKRSQTEYKKRSPFKDKLQSLFTLRKPKSDSGKSASSQNKDEASRRSMPSLSYDRGCSTLTQEHNTHKVKSCFCATRSEMRHVSPQYNCYNRHSKHRQGTRHHHGAQHQPHHHMNVSINVSVISSSFSGSGNSPEVSIMTQSVDASLGDGGSPSICPSSPMSQSMIEGACFPGSPVIDNTLCPGSPLSHSLMSSHSMSNQSLSHHSIMSGQSAPSYYSSHSTSGQSPSMYQSSQSTSGQSSHSYHSAHSLGSPTTLPQRSPLTKGGSTSPTSSSPLNDISNNYGMNGTVTTNKNNCYGASYDGAYNSSSESSSNADFISSLLKLKDCGWYWGPLSWDEAENKLASKPDGSFLVRDSSDDRYILSLSFRSQGTTHHTRIEHYKGMFSFYSQPTSHGAATIVEFIEKAMEHSHSGKFLYFLRPRAPGFPPAPVQLLYPVSRLLNMQSLQHMCRFIILKQVRKDHIDRLPIPPRLKEYLKQNQYYTEYLGGDVTEYPQY